MGMRAVIADDEVLIRMYIREILENNGYEVAGGGGGWNVEWTPSPCAGSRGRTL